MTTNHVSPVRAKPGDHLFPSGRVTEVNIGTCNGGTKRALEVFVPGKGLTEFYTDDHTLFSNFHQFIMDAARWDHGKEMILISREEFDEMVGLV